MPRPDLTRVPEYYHKYIDKVKEDDLLTALRNSATTLFNLLNNLPEEKQNYRYAEGKWTIKELVQHLMDSERVFSYRALRFSRKDESRLPGFNEKHFGENAKADKRNWNEMLDEFAGLLKADLAMFASFDNEQLEQSGIASDRPVYVLAIGFICAGHILHHCDVIKERYL